VRRILPATALLVVIGCSGVVRDYSALAVSMSQRYGTTKVRHITHGDQQRLELTLTGRRWRGTDVGFPDSAKAVAQYAMSQLDEANRPDTVVVRIRTVSQWFGMRTGTSGMHFGAGEL
jgi:hypothetical protein